MKKISTLYKKDPKDLSRVINELDPDNEWVLNDEGIPTRKFDGTATAIIDCELYKRYDVKPDKKKNNIFRIGSIVSKKSQKQFKNGELGDEIIEFVENPQSPNNSPAVRLKNSDTIVNLSCLMVVGNWNIHNFKDIPQGAIPCQDPDTITGHWPHWIKCDRNNPADKWHFEAFDNMLSGVIIPANFDPNRFDGTYELCGEKIQGNPEHINGVKLIAHGCEILPITDFSFDGLKDYLSNPELDIEGIVFHHKTDDRMCKIRKSDFGFKRK